MSRVLAGERAHRGIAELGALESTVRHCRICTDRFAETVTSHVPEPLPWLSDRAPVLIASQAPGMRAQKSRVLFDDPSGDRLRLWLGVDRATFYDRTHFAILPMAFCFPGYDAQGSDLPPPKVCAATWRVRALAAMPQVRLILLIGAHAQGWHLGRCAGGVTERVRRWRDVGAGVMPLPHPSWRNSVWLKRNPWFEAELLPVLRARISTCIAEAG